MRCYRVSEWGYLPFQSETHPEGIPEADALCLYREAQIQQSMLDLKGQSVLELHHKRLRAQQVVGVLVARGCRLEILPKIGDESDPIARRSLVHMLARTLDLRLASSGATDVHGQETDLLEVLIRLFSEQLYRAVHRGLPRNYHAVEADLPVLRGQLNVPQQFTRLAASPQLLACRFDELSSDIPLNQVLKAATVRLGKITRSMRNKRLLMELSLAFADVRDVDPLALLASNPVQIDRTNSAYRELLSLAVLFLKGWRQSIYRGEGRGYSLLFEMNTLFEEFVGRSLARLSLRLDATVSLQGPRSYVLKDEVGAQVFATKPDVHLRHKLTGDVQIVDTKWKRLKQTEKGAPFGISNSDIYQMMAYAEVYKAVGVVLVYPHAPEVAAEPGVLKCYRTVSTNRQIAIATLSLSEISTVDAQLQNTFQLGSADKLMRMG